MSWSSGSGTPPLLRATRASHQAAAQPSKHTECPEYLRPYPQFCMRRGAICVCYVRGRPAEGATDALSAVHSLAKHFDLHCGDVDSAGVRAYLKGTQHPQRLFRVVLSSSAMFLWIDVNLRTHPAWQRIRSADDCACRVRYAQPHSGANCSTREYCLRPGRTGSHGKGRDGSALAIVARHAFFRLTCSSTPQGEMWRSSSIELVGVRR